MVSQKHVFWEALVIAVFVFGVGLLFGLWVENMRTDDIIEMYSQSDLSLLDLKLQTDILDLEISCKNLIKSNIEFADQIYFESVYLRKYEDSNTLSSSIILQHKKYDLLRTMLWINSIKIKEKCDADYVNVVYFYQYDDPSLEQKARQSVFSKVLEEVKNRQGDKIILIPIAADLEIKSLELLKSQYNITKFPSILLDEKIKITEIEDIADVEKYFN